MKTDNAQFRNAFPGKLLFYALYPLRLALTALAFALFGLGGIVFALAVTPLLPKESLRARRQAARRVVRCWFGIFVRIIGWLGLVRVEVKNPEALSKPGAILAANHPSLIDVVCLIAVVPEATTIVKASLMRNIFLRPPIAGAGYVANNAGPEALGELAEELESGASFVIFPEGTRTPIDPAEMPKMHRGAAQVALHSGRPVTPVRITADPKWLTKEKAWWHLPPRPMTLTFEALPEIEVTPWLGLYNQSPRKAAICLTEEIGRTLFARYTP